MQIENKQVWGGWIKWVFVLLALWAVLAPKGHAQPYQLTVQSGVTPAPQNVGGQVVGVVGGATLYYWVAANFPGGQGPATGPVLVTRTVGIPNLTVQNYVSISWAPVPGALTYDVWRSSTPTNPVMGGTCTSCGVVANTPLTTANDQGAGFAYTDPAQIQAGQAVLTIDNQSSANGPFLNMAFFNNQYRLGLIRGFTGNAGCVEIDTNGYLYSTSQACGTGSGGGGFYQTIEGNNVARTQRLALNFLFGSGILGAFNDSASPSRTSLTFTADTSVLLDRNTGTSNVDNTCIPASGSGTTFICSMAGGVPLSAYTNGMPVMFRPDVTLTGSPTLNINTQGPKPIFAADGITPATGEAGRSYWLIYNSTLSGGGGAFTMPPISNPVPMIRDLPIGVCSPGGGVTQFWQSGSGTAAACIGPTNSYARFDLATGGSGATTPFRIPSTWDGAGVRLTITAVTFLGSAGTSIFEADIACPANITAALTYGAPSTGTANLVLPDGTPSTVVIGPISMSGCTANNTAMLRLKRTGGTLGLGFTAVIEPALSIGVR